MNDTTSTPTSETPVGSSDLARWVHLVEQAQEHLQTAINSATVEGGLLYSQIAMAEAQLATTTVLLEIAHVYRARSARFLDLDLRDTGDVLKDAITEPLG